MTQYILKSVLVAEIESKKNRAQYLGDNAINGSMQQFYDGMKQSCVDILSFINTLEVEETKNTELLKVRGYLVRDKDDYTSIHSEKPHRGKTEWVDDSCLITINDARLIPGIEFENEPVEIEVTLKRLKAKRE